MSADADRPLEAPSPNQDDRPDGVAIDMLILHYTGMQSGQAAIDRLRDPAARVSSHYVVDEDGAVVRLVAERRRAYHAGISFWRGGRALNDRSIGIEIVNPGHEWGYRPFPATQMRTVAALCHAIVSRHPVPPRNVVAHSDVAPDRKQDPGELFDWPGLAAAGVGVWPAGEADLTAADEAPLGAVRRALRRIGYEVPDGASEDALGAVLRAFQRHWRQEAITGLADHGTRARVFGLDALLLGEA